MKKLTFHHTKAYLQVVLLKCLLNYFYHRYNFVCRQNKTSMSELEQIMVPLPLAHTHDLLLHKWTPQEGEISRTETLYLFPPHMKNLIIAHGLFWLLLYNWTVRFSVYGGNIYVVKIMFGKNIVHETFCSMYDSVHGRLG